MATVISDLVVKISTDASALKKGIEEAKGEFSKFTEVGDKLVGVGKSLSTYVTAPILAAGAASIKMAADIDKGVGEIVTLFGLTGTEADKMSEKLKTGIAGVSNEVGIAQDAITEGLYNAISAGVPEENVFDFMTVAAKASVAGVTDINTAVDGISTALNAYGLEASEAGRVSDSMFAAVQGGKTTFEELSGALFNVAPAAAAAGVSMEEINAGIATLTASGVPTSVATTQLRAALSGLQRPSEDLNKIFQDLGYESAQVAIQSKGLGFALDAVKKASGGNNGELQKLLGSVEAVSAANIIAGTGAEKFADELDRQAKSAGATEKAFETMQKTTAQQFQKVMVSLQNIAIRLGDALLPAVNAVLGAVEDLLTWFNSLSEGTQTFIGIIVGVAAAIGPVLVVIGKLMTFLPAIKVAFVALTGPIGLTVAAVAALGAAVYYIYDNWGAITDWFSNLWTSVKLVFLQFVDAHLAIASKLFGWIPGAEDMIGGLRTQIGTMIEGAKVEAEAKKVEQATRRATAEAEALKDEGGKASDSMEGLGVVGEQAGEAIATGMQGAVAGVKSLTEQVDEIINDYLDEFAASEREFAFILKLNDVDMVKDKISDTEAALRSLARDTTIGIDDENVVNLQKRLANLRGELIDLEAQSKVTKLFDSKTFEEISSAVMVTEETFSKLSLRIGEARSNSVAAESSLQALSDVFESNLEMNMLVTEQLDEFADTLIDTTGTVGLYEDALFGLSLKSEQGATSSQILAEKIDLTRSYLEDAVLAYGETSEEAEFYRRKLAELEKEQSSFAGTMQRIGDQYFPSMNKAFVAGKSAVTSFKSAFSGDNGKPFLQNIDEGLLAVRDSIMFAKAAMSEFGNVAGLVLTGLDLLVPGLGTTVTTVLSILNTLGIDVKGILDAATDALLGFIGAGGGGGASGFTVLFNMFNQLGYAINETLSAITDFNFSPQVLKDTFTEIKNAGGDFEDYIEALAEKAGISFGEMLAAFTEADILKMKTLGWTGMYDPNTGQKAEVSPEMAAAIMAELQALQDSGNFTAQEILDMLLAKYGKTPLVTMGIAQMLGLPALAQGGIVSGAMLAMVGDNAHAATDPEIVSPLSKLKAMLVDPTLDAVANMMGYGNGTTQVIYVNLDGRVLSQSVFENLPDIVRINNGVTI